VGRSTARRQVFHLLLGDVEPDPVVRPGHGADRDGDFLPAPEMPFLEQHVGHPVVVRVHDEALHLPDLAVGSVDPRALAHLDLTEWDNVVDNDPHGM